MIDKIRTWVLTQWERYEDEFDAAAFVTAVAVVVYSVLYAIHWVVSTTLNFTGLKYVLLLWIGISIGRVIALYLNDRDKEKETDDESFIG